MIVIKEKKSKKIGIYISIYIYIYISENRPTLVWTWIHSQGSPEQSLLDALSMVR